jgi:hypothetical protein
MIAPTILTLADASSAASVMRSYVVPVIRTLSVVASLVCIFFLINGGYHYMTSSGKPERLEQAKHVLKNALLGLIVVLAAGVLTTILTHAYAGSSSALTQKLPHLGSVQPKPVSNGLVDILIKAITGLLNNIVQSIAAPFLKALAFFTSATPLMADNSSVFNLWLAIVGISDVLFVLVVALLGFHIMGASTFGFDEIEFKHLLPRLALVFLLVNTSIFAIDGIIELSNVMIRAINDTGASSVWTTLTNVTKGSGGLGVASLLIMVAFLIFSVILLVYYVGRIVTLYLGAVLAPVVLLLWLVPGFRDFSESAAKTYLVTIFVLFVHVVILELAASLFAGIHGTGGVLPDTNDLMAMIVGLATVIALLKTQGVMMQFSYASIGPRNARKLSGQFMTGISYLGARGKAVSSTVSSSRNSQGTQIISRPAKSSNRANTTRYTQPKGANTEAKPKSTSKAKTGTTTVAPKLANTSTPTGSSQPPKPPKIMEKP